MNHTKQQYENYTGADFQVWKALFERQMLLLEQHASAHWLEAAIRVGFTPHRIPRFTEVNQLLARYTGWSLQEVPSIVPNEVFFPLLEKGIFTATSWLRRMDQLDYLEEPDMFHDVFGHVPLLSEPAFAKFFKGLGALGAKYVNSPMAVELVGRVYWFTIEFGLISEGGRTKIYGAGIISSHRESKYALSGTPRHAPFELKAVLDTVYDNMRIQDLYYVIDSYEQLFACLPELELALQQVHDREMPHRVASLHKAPG